MQRPSHLGVDPVDALHDETTMKITVVGLGAVGGLMAARLANAGHAVSGLARGATLAAIRRHGVRLDAGGENGITGTPLEATYDAGALGLQDLVIVAVKGPALAAVAGQIQPLLGPETMVMPAMNGVPWWFLRAGTSAAAVAGRRLASVDPDGRIETCLPLDRVVGCVVHLACSSPEPGLVRLGFGNRLIVGEPAGGRSARVDSVVALLDGAGFEAEPSTDIRQQIWYKLWGNMTMNPVSALTGSDSHAILDDPLVLDFMLGAMRESAQIGDAIGCSITESGHERMAIARALGPFKTSMLQDAIAARPLELDALVGAVHEIGGHLGLAMPNIGALLGLARLMARNRGLYPAAVGAAPAV